MSKALRIVNRREQVQRLLVRGLSVSEIARSVEPLVNEKTIQRDIAWIRGMNEQWWRENSEVKARLVHYLKERVDAMREVIREGWLVVYEAKDDLKTRIGGLNVILGAEKALNELHGFTGMSLLDLEVQEKIRQVDAEMREMRRLAGLAERNRIEP